MPPITIWVATSITAISLIILYIGEVTVDPSQAVQPIIFQFNFKDHDTFRSCNNGERSQNQWNPCEKRTPFRYPWYRYLQTQPSHNGERKRNHTGNVNDVASQTSSSFSSRNEPSNSLSPSNAPPISPSSSESVTTTTAPSESQSNISQTPFNDITPPPQINNQNTNNDTGVPSDINGKTLPTSPVDISFTVGATNDSSASLNPTLNPPDDSIINNGNSPTDLTFMVDGTNNNNVTPTSNTSETLDPTLNNNQTNSSEPMDVIMMNNETNTSLTNQTEPTNNETILSNVTSLPATENVVAQPPEWSGCVDPANRDVLLKKGRQTTLCITVSDGNDWALGVNYARWLFRPIADEYSHFTVQNSYKDLILDSNIYKDRVSIHVASQKALSFIRRYYDESEGKIYPYLTAILDVRDGVVVGIAWDDACVFCQFSNRCEENTFDFAGNLTTLGKEKTKGCYITKEECDEFYSRGTHECDLNIYFVWTGSDRNGRILTSSGSRWSAFPPRNIPKIPTFKEIKDTVKQKVNNTIEDIKDSVQNKVDETVDDIKDSVHNLTALIPGGSD